MGMSETAIDGHLAAEARPPDDRVGRIVIDPVLRPRPWHQLVREERCEGIGAVKIPLPRFRAAVFDPDYDQWGNLSSGPKIIQDDVHHSEPTVERNHQPAPFPVVLIAGRG